MLAENQLYREAVTAVLASKQGLDVVGMNSPRGITGSELRRQAPDIILVDVATKDSASVLKAIVSASSAKILALGVAEAELEVIAYAEAGIAGYVPPDGSLSDLLATIKSVASDEMPLSPRIAASLIRRVATLAAERTTAPAYQQLTTREEEIVKLVDDGLSNKEIARRLCIELSTVKNHVHSILDKLGARRRGEAAARFRASRERLN